MKLVGQPLTLSRTPSKIAAPPPRLGEHTDEVLKEFGFKPKEIAALRKAKATILMAGRPAIQHLQRDPARP